MSDEERKVELGKALVEATQEASALTLGTLQHLLTKALAYPILDRDKPLVAASQLVAVLLTLDQHLGHIGPDNYTQTMTQVQKLMEAELTGKSRASLGRLSALLHPLAAFAKFTPKS